MREALETWKGPKDEVLVATKVGHFRNFTDGRPTWDVDGRPENLIRRGKESALALGVDTIDLLYFHRPDPKVPYNESVEAIKQLVDEAWRRRPVSPTLHRANRHCARYSGRQARGRAKPVLADSPGDPGHARLLRKVAWPSLCWSPLGGYRHPYDETKFDPFREVAAATA